jgi:hypothetical protein
MKPGAFKLCGLHTGFNSLPHRASSSDFLAAALAARWGAVRASQRRVTRCSISAAPIIFRISFNTSSASSCATRAQSALKSPELRSRIIVTWLLRACRRGGITSAMLARVLLYKLPRRLSSTSPNPSTTRCIALFEAPARKAKSVPFEKNWKKMVHAKATEVRPHHSLFTRGGSTALTRSLRGGTWGAETESAPGATLICVHATRWMAKSAKKSGVLFDVWSKLRVTKTPCSQNEMCLCLCAFDTHTLPRDAAPHTPSTTPPSACDEEFENFFYFFIAKVFRGPSSSLASGFHDTQNISKTHSPSSSLPLPMHGASHAHTQSTAPQSEHARRCKNRESPPLSPRGLSYIR